MAVFRVERNKGYTVMSNHHLRNKELSLKAKGLLSQINIGYMIRAPTFRRSTQRQEPHPPTTEYRRAAELTQRGDSRLYQRAVFLCGGIR